MIDPSPEIIAIIMLVGVLVGVSTGYPLAIVVGALGLIVGATVFGFGVVDILYTRAADLMMNYIILAVPMFVFMGTMLERSGITERLYDALYLWLGGLRGGLAIATVLIGTILAACVGIIAASISMLALVALPSMIRKGYDRGLASGSVVAGGSLGILIPPSVMLVIYGPMAGISVGKLFFGAFMPGFLLSGLYCSYIALHSLFKPEIAPAVPVEERRVPFIRKTATLLYSLVPPVLLILAVLGSIFFGIAPPTEAAGIGAFVATLLAIAYRRFSWQVLRDVTLHTFKLCGFILLIGSMAFAFTGVFIGAGCGYAVEDLIMAAPGGKWAVLAIMMFIIFVLGFLIDWIGIVFIMVPIITPIAAAAGFHPVWFAIMMCINLQMSFMTPPYAPGIFILRGSAPPELGITMAEVIRGVIPYVILVIVGLGLCIAFPEIITWLPGQMIR